MKNDLLTSIVTAVITTIIGFVVCNLLIPKVEPYTVKTVDSDLSIDVSSPDPEVFNAKAINPTVEVYVGECTNIDSESGKCLDDADGGSTGLNEDVLDILKGDQ